MPPSTWMHSCAQDTAALAASVAAAAAAKLPPAAAPRGLVERTGRVPDDGGRLLGRDQHPGAAVLDRLELADRTAELMPELRVLGGGLHGPVRDTDRLGAEQSGGKAATEPSPSRRSCRSAGTITSRAVTAAEPRGSGRGPSAAVMSQAVRVDRDPDSAAAVRCRQDDQVRAGSAEYVRRRCRR